LVGWETSSSCWEVLSCVACQDASDFIAGAVTSVGVQKLMQMEVKMCVACLNLCSLLRWKHLHCWWRHQF
jgi:hypothetical protein